MTPCDNEYGVRREVVQPFGDTVYTEKYDTSEVQGSERRGIPQTVYICGLCDPLSY